MPSKLFDEVNLHINDPENCVRLRRDDINVFSNLFRNFLERNFGSARERLFHPKQTIPEPSTDITSGNHKMFAPAANINVREITLVSLCHWRPPP